MTQRSYAENCGIGPPVKSTKAVKSRKIISRDYFIRAINWAHMLDDDEPIWSCSFQKEYLGFGGVIREADLDLLVDFLNNYWSLTESRRRCHWKAGEIRPYYVPSSMTRTSPGPTNRSTKK